MRVWWLGSRVSRLGFRGCLEVGECSGDEDVGEVVHPHQCLPEGEHHASIRVSGLGLRIWGFGHWTLGIWYWVVGIEKS